MNHTEASPETTLVLRRTFDATPERVFAAWTQPDVICAWMAPGERHVSEASIDLREGGAYRFAFAGPDGDTMYAFGVYRAIRKPGHLTMTWSWEEDEKELEHETLLSLDFNDLGGGKTELVLTHANFRDETQRDNHNGGWSAALDKFPAYLANIA